MTYSKDIFPRELLPAIMLKVLKTKGMIETIFVKNTWIQVSKWRKTVLL